MRTQEQINSILHEIQIRIGAMKNISDLQLQVPVDGYLEDDEWLNVVVTPAKSGVRAYEYVEALSQLEKGLRASGFDHVLLVPAISE